MRGWVPMWIVATAITILVVAAILFQLGGEITGQSGSAVSTAWNRLAEAFIGG